MPGCVEFERPTSETIEERLLYPFSATKQTSKLVVVFFIVTSVVRFIWSQKHCISSDTIKAALVFRLLNAFNVNQQQRDMLCLH